MFLYFLVYCFLLYFVGHVCCLLGEGADYENLQDQQFDIPEQIQKYITKYTSIVDMVHGGLLSQPLCGPWSVDRVRSIVHANLQSSPFSFVKLNHSFMSYAILPFQPLSYLVFIPAAQSSFLLQFYLFKNPKTSSVYLQFYHPTSKAHNFQTVAPF